MTASIINKPISSTFATSYLTKIDIYKTLLPQSRALTINSNDFPHNGYYPHATVCV